MARSIFALAVVLGLVACGGSTISGDEPDASSDPLPDGGCEVRTCEELGADCGAIDDGCGEMLACGECPAPQFCGESGVPNRCACAHETDQELCARLGATCGTLEGHDLCGAARTVASCGSCSAPLTCGGGGIAGTCGETTCAPENDAAFCRRLGKACGPASGTDLCGDPRTVANCGNCDVEFATGKVLGYLFGDGNYYPPLAVPVDADFAAGGGTMASDFIRAACKAGYAGKIRAPSQPNPVINCATFTGFGGGGQHVRILGYPWPYGGNITQYAAQASTASHKGFLSGLLPGEGGVGGLIDDQSICASGCGPYTDGNRIDVKLTALVALMHDNPGMANGGFKTVRKVNASGGACSAPNCRKVLINASTEGCYFNHTYGFDFISYKRVPGAVCNSSGACVEPAVCSL